MPDKKKVRIAFDAALTVMLVAEMFIEFTGTFLHEVIGFAFFATIIAHLALAARWMKGTAGAAKAGRLHGKRAALAVMGILLAVTVVVLGVSSVAISTILSSAGFSWPLGSYAMWATIHSVSAYALCALVAIHLAMHWTFLASALKVPYDPSRRRAISTGVHVVAAAGAVGLGMLALGEALPRTASASANDGQSTAAGGSQGISADNGQSASGGGSQANAPSNRRGRGFDGPVSDRSAGPGEQGGPSSSSSSAKGTTDPGEESGSTSTATPQAGGSDGESATTDICTLCRKQCPLSAPKCDKPYKAGLI